MASHAFKRPVGDSEGTIPPAASQEDPLEVFAGLMGVDPGALQRVEGAGDAVPGAPEIAAAPPLVRSIAPFAAVPTETQVPAAAPAPAAVSEPKPVKTVSVSPNGALLPSGAGAAALDAPPPPAAAQDAPAAPLVNPPTPVPRP